MKRYLLFAGMLLGFCFSAYAQILHPVKWSYAAEKTEPGQAILFLKTQIDPGWHIYSTHQKDGGPIKTTFNFEASDGYSFDGELIEPKPMSKHEDTFNMEVQYFEKSVIFRQKVKLKSKVPIAVKGKLTYMVCNDHQCLSPETVEFSIPVN
jgi:DsbC/DsbD-like thiol-disulfide interchange protein